MVIFFEGWALLTFQECRVSNLGSPENRTKFLHIFWEEILNTPDIYTPVILEVCSGFFCEVLSHHTQETVSFPVFDYIFTLAPNDLFALVVCGEV